MIAAVGREELARTAALNAAGAVASSAVFWTTFERAAAANAAGLISVSGVRVSPPITRQVAFAATGSISSSGISVVSASAALSATGTITAVGREPSPAARRWARPDSGGERRGPRCPPAQRSPHRHRPDRHQRGQVLDPHPQRRPERDRGGQLERDRCRRRHDLERSAALTATGSIATAARETLSRSAALAATAAIASAGRELLPRLVRVDATAQIAAAGQRRLHRQAALGATGQIQAGAATAAVVNAPPPSPPPAPLSLLEHTGSSAAPPLSPPPARSPRSVGVRLRSAAWPPRARRDRRPGRSCPARCSDLGNRAIQAPGCGSMSAAPPSLLPGSWRRSGSGASSGPRSSPRPGTSRSATSARTAAPLLDGCRHGHRHPPAATLRAGSLEATATWETIAGGTTAQFAFDAVATITVAGAWPAGAISTPTTGFIYGAYLGAIQGGSNGRIAAGTDGQLARTGG